MPRTSAPQPIAGLLERVARKMGVERQLSEHRVLYVWAEAVGPHISNSLRPLSYADGVLVLEARSAAWMNEGSFLKTQLIARLNTHLGRAHVRDLRFKLGAGFAPLHAPSAPPARPAPPSPEEITEITEELGADTGARLVARARAFQKRRS